MGIISIRNLKNEDYSSCFSRCMDKRVATSWCKKFGNNTRKFQRRYEICGYYDPTSQHGGPRERRDAEDDFRVTWDNPELALKQITTGYRKWANRYIAECSLQPATQANRANKWYGILLGKIESNEGSGY